MESAKLKNIILIILIVTNIFLLSLMVFQRLESRQYHQKALADAVALLEQRGISVRQEAIPTLDFPAPMTLVRDQAGEKEVFTALLGEDTVLTQRGLVSLYTGPLGQAEVRGDGSFSVKLEPGAYPLAQSSDPDNYVLAFLARRMGISGQVDRVTDDTVTVTQIWDNSPVFSCQVTVTYGQGSLVSVVGTRLVGQPAADAQTALPLSTATLLVRFRAGLIDSGDTCTAVLSATQGYTLSSGADGKLRLTPVLRLETDTNPYILDALTGELHRA